MLGSETLGPRNESEALTPHRFSLGRVGPGGESRGAWNVAAGSGPLLSGWGGASFSAKRPNPPWGSSLVRGKVSRRKCRSKSVWNIISLLLVSFLLLKILLSKPQPRHYVFRFPHLFMW